MDHMHWPQWTVLVLYLLAVGGAVGRFGEPKRDYYDLIDVLGPAAGLWLLWMGGFFGN
jgi:hypothetical protein